MKTFVNPAYSNRLSDSSEIPWQELYHVLRPLVKRWVYSSHVPSWKGQEDDIVEDIVQEAIVRTLKYARRADSGEVTPIDSLERMSIVIAHNYCKDMRRKDYRLSRISSHEQKFGEHVVISTKIDAAEVALDNVFREWVFIKASQSIVKFPDKQRTALLIDLANRMDFGQTPTSLQQAFLNQDIDLHDYQRSLPDDSVARSRRAALLSLAYKRLAKDRLTYA